MSKILYVNFKHIIYHLIRKRLNNYEVQEEHDYINYNYFLFSIAGACASDANATERQEITAPGILTVYNINKYLTITLKDNKNNTIAGANITVNINGEKTYATNQNGQVKINTKTLTPKIYKVEISYAGNETHNGTQATSNILSIKAKPILTAKNKVFKSTTKIKKYSVSLKNNLKAPMKKVKVSLTIGKKTYNAKTNSKGIATFKLTKLTKTSKATVKYLGNKNYYAASKKVKLTSI